MSKKLTPEQIARAQEIKERPEVRKHEAKLRQIDSDARTPKQRLARLDKLGHTAKKERARLAVMVSDPAPKTVAKTKGKRNRRK